MSTIRYSCVCLLISLGLVNYGLAQEVVSSGGEHFENPEGSISWTIGLLSHKTISSNDLILSQGFHQPDVIITSVVDLPQHQLKLKAFPNPTTQWIQLQFTKGFRAETFQTQVIDQFGRLFLDQPLKDPTTDLDFSGLASGVYLIRIRSNDQSVHTFKVIKQ